MSDPLLTTLVIVGGAAGAAARYLVDDLVSRLAAGRLPWGTTAVNLLGSLALGLLLGLSSAGDPSYALLGVGFCGAFTTWSTLALEAAQLLRPAPATACAYLAVNLAGGLGLALLGLIATGGLSG